jgi:hypothetical protein
VAEDWLVVVVVVVEESGVGEWNRLWMNEAPVGVAGVVARKAWGAVVEVAPEEVWIVVPLEAQRPICL